MPLPSIRQKRVGVLFGGLSVEREGSIRPGAAVAKALRGLGYPIVEIDVQKDLPARLVAERIDLAFIALHGRYGEDGCVQGLLESMFIPYTGSGVLASSVGMEKVFAKQIFIAEGIPTPRHVAYRTSADPPRRFAPLPFPLPVVVQPSRHA